MRTNYELNLPVKSAEIYADFLRCNDFYFTSRDFFGDYVHFDLYLSETEAETADRFLATI